MVTLVADYYSGSERQGFLGLQSSMMAFGGVVFLLVGGAVAELGWRYPFAMYLTALVLLPLAAIFLAEPERATTPENSAKNRVRPAVAWAPYLSILGIAVTGMALFYQVPVQMPFYLTERMNVSPSRVGMSIAMLTLAAAITASQYRKIRTRFSFQAITAMMYGLMGVSYVVIALARGLPMVYAGLVIGGAGAGLLMPNISVWTAEIAPPSLRGSMMGGANSLLFVGQFFAPILVAPIQAQGGLAGWSGVFGVTGILSLAVSLVILLGSLRYRGAREVKTLEASD
jgi:MFS family permease